MRFLFEIAVGSTTFALWVFLAIAGLRLCGVRLPFPLSRRRGTETQAALIGLGKRGYVFVKGVLLFGWGTFVGITISDYVSRRCFGTENGLRWISATLALVIFSACGVFFGVYDWNSSARPELRRSGNC
jgi:hypothetical protein